MFGLIVCVCVCFVGDLVLFDIKDDFHIVYFGLKQYISEILIRIMRPLLSCPCLSSAGITFDAKLVDLVCICCCFINHAQPHKL